MTQDSAQLRVLRQVLGSDDLRLFPNKSLEAAIGSDDSRLFPNKSLAAGVGV